MPWIRFTTNYTVRATHGAKYASGQEVELSEASANHFVNAGVAISIPPPLAGVARPTRITIPPPNKPPPGVTTPAPPKPPPSVTAPPPTAPVEAPTVTSIEATTSEQVDSPASPAPAVPAPVPPVPQAAPAPASQPRLSARSRAQTPPTGS